VEAVRVHVTENDIIRSIKNIELSPIRLALCRSLRCEDDRLDIHKDEIKVWLYDDSDHLSYKFKSMEDYSTFNDFLDQWLRYSTDESIETFDAYPFSFLLMEENNDSRTNSRYRIAADFAYHEFADRPSSDKKNLKFRLTDDDE
jgi:hypothetical protein